MEIKITKYLDVKSPISAYEKVDGPIMKEAGVDVYMPRPNEDFRQELVKSNPGTKVVGDANNWTIEKNFEMLMRFTDGKYFIYGNIQIPLGVGMLIPEGYYIDLRSKSGGFKNYYTSITGLIDATYTYGCGCQIYLLDPLETVILLPNEKISQIVVQKHYPITAFTELPIEEFEALPEVTLRRELRKGGFGHTGKFDK